MIMSVFSVLDKAIGAFLPPFFARAKGEAIRSFSEACNDDKHQFHRHGLDYVLCYLGDFDDSSGTFSGLREPERVISAIECQVPDNPFSEFTEQVRENLVRPGTPVRGNG